ncbi:glycosyltransferase family 4 protein [Fodinibius sp. AD559]|uniref:glycosyltransferase family 4 protein n=1 Tax=Fodinibius sp. AD559 TaxID=3424179 RepID=UPI004046B667
MKTLYIIAKGMAKLPDEEITKLEKQNRHPRVSLLENALSADLLDERYFQEKAPAFRRWLYKKIPVTIAQVVEALILQRKYDVIFTQSEKVGLPLALLMKYFRMRTPHVMIISRITSMDPRKSQQKKWFLKHAQEAISRILIWSSQQRQIAIDELGIPASKVTLLRRGTDQLFWHPMESEDGANGICAVGMEMRDYPTLVEALRELHIPCHIAVGAARGEIFDTVKKLYDIDELPEHISVGRKPYEELRKLYASCNFTVVPLLPSDSDNGLTAILESMAMGKPVICSRTEGQVDVIEDGVTGIFVEQGNPEALRNAIAELWNNPKRAEEMGKAARKYVEENHSMEQFVDEIKEEVLDVMGRSRQAKSIRSTPKLGAEV